MAERTTGGGDGRFYSRSWWWHCVGRFGVNSLSCSCRVGFAPDYIADTDNKQASNQADVRTEPRFKIRDPELCGQSRHDGYRWLWFGPIAASGGVGGASYVGT